MSFSYNMTDTAERSEECEGHGQDEERLKKLAYNDDSDTELEEDTITSSLERVGVTLPSFMIPKLDFPSPIAVSKKINDYLAQSVSMDHSQSSKITELISGLVNKRTTELKNLYSEVSQSLTGIVNTNIDHPVEHYIEEIQNDENTKEIEEKKTPQQEDSTKTTNELIQYEDLTKLTFEQFQDQQFLRHRIRQILNLDIDPNSQRRLIQTLMSRSYIEKQRHLKHQVECLGKSNAGHEDEDEDEEEEDDALDDDEVTLTKKDIEPTYYSLEDDILGCKHYQRNCKIECFVCHKWYPCRLCHDEENPSHQLDRKSTKHILCMFCFTPQHPGQYCIECNEELSKYYCSKCFLYDNDPTKNIYHCDKCGICRLGLGLNQDYFHCDSCNTCISIELQANHVCIENSTRSNCPICDEFMFNSNENVVFMNCGHPIHEKCYSQHTLHSYKCPTCSKTVVNMELQFRMRDNEIKQSIMPEEMKHWITEIKCIDCGGMSRVPYHYLGHKCDHCLSYNTMHCKVLKGENETEVMNLREDNDNETSEKLYLAERFVTNSLKQNFEFEQEVEVEDDENRRLEDRKNITEADNSIDHDYVDNFIRVINNFEAYSSIGDAFKDWISTSVQHDMSDAEEE